MSPQHAVGHVNYLGARLRLSAFISRPEEEEEEGAVIAADPQVSSEGWGGLWWVRDGHSPTDFLSDTNSRLQAERSWKVPGVRFQTVWTLGAALIGYMYYFFSEGYLVFAGYSWLGFRWEFSNQRFASHV